MPNDKSALLQQLRIDRDKPPPRQASRVWGTLIALLMAVIIVGAVWLFGLREAAIPVHAAVARPVATGAGSASPRASLLDASGYVVARRQATVSAKVAGKLKELRVEEGQRVADGEVIARLDDVNTVAAFNQTRAQLDQASRVLEDARPIFERNQKQLAAGLISQDVFDNAKATFDQAETNVRVLQAGLAIARQNLDDDIVRAPFAGVVTVKAAQPGEIVSPLSAGAGFTRTGIATIVDMDSLEVEVDVSENFINRVHPGQACTVTLNAYPDWQIPGELIAIIPTADRSKATVKVRIGFKQKDPRILPEMGARVAFLNDAAAASSSAPSTATATGVMVPVAAVQGSGDQGNLYVIAGDVVRRRSVRLGARSPEGQLVMSGVAAGERVVVGGLDQLKDGVKVQVAE